MADQAAASPNLTERDVQNYAQLLVTADAFKEIIRRIKADILKKWANDPDAVKREMYYYDIQAVGTFEAKLAVLAQAGTLDERKIEEAKRREASYRARDPA